MKRPEQAIHIACAQFLRAALPPQIVWFHIPNGGKRTRAEASLFKVMGQLAGAPDLMFILPNGQAAFIELKAPGMHLSEVQEEFRRRVTALKCGYAVARSVDDVERTLSKWLDLFGLTLRARTFRPAPLAPRAVA